MPRAIIHTRPDRKLTEFFSTKPRTAPRPGQPIYDGSSPSERQSIISISSDDVNLSPKKSDRESKSIPQHVARDEHSPCLSSLSSISTDEDEADLELDLSTSPKKSDREPKSIPQHVARDEHSPCLSSLSSISTDEDEADLELDLSTFAKGRTVKLTEPSTYSVTPLGVGTRRSARHVDLPAPDYARKLELFRDYRPSSGKGKYDVDGKGKSKMTASLGNSNKVMVPEACPLDMLLKDRDREGARKARVETKRKGAHSDPFDSDPALSRGSNTFETPKRVHPRAKTESPGSDMPSPHDGHVLLMGAAAREELLGKKAAKAVGKILDSDRKKRSNTEEKQSDVLFWSKDVKGDNDIVPDLVATNTCHPLLTALNDAMNRKEYDVASHLVDSGALSSAPLSVPLLDWLFATAMSTACRDVSLSAYRSLLVLHREVCSPVALARPYLSSTRLLRPLIKLGVNTQVAEMFGAEVDDMVSPMGIIPEMKVEMLCRFFSMLEVLSRSQSIDPMAIPSIVSILLLLSLDPSAVPELQQDAVSAIEAVLASLNVTRIIELDTCKFVLRVTKELAFTPDLQLRLLTLLPGCSPSSGRVRRWTAWAMLGGDLQTFHDCSDVPPIQLMVDLFSKTSPGVVKLEVTPDTDYQQLGALVNILSVAMTDVDAYVRHANGSVLTRHLYEALEQMNGKIVDNRAAHMDRTKTKEAINRLHKRLIYQRHAVLEKLRTKTGKMDQFLVAKPKSASRTKSEDRSE